MISILSPISLSARRGAKCRSYWSNAYWQLIGAAMLTGAPACNEPDIPTPGDTGEYDGSAAMSGPVEAGARANDAGGPRAQPDASPPPPRRLGVTCTMPPEACVVALSGTLARHVCALMADQTVRCWGNDMVFGGTGSGALGRGASVSLEEAATPARVRGLVGVTQVSVGPAGATCARTQAGAVWCWGDNKRARLGVPVRTGGIAEPREVAGLPPVDEVQIGSYAACAIASSDQSVLCWGHSDYIPELRRYYGAAPVRIPAFGAAVESLRVMPSRAGVLGYYGDTVVALHHDGTLSSAGDAPAGEYSVRSAPAELKNVSLVGEFSLIVSRASPYSWVRPPKEGCDDPDSPCPTPPLPAILSPLYLPSAVDMVDINTDALFGGSALSASGILYLWGDNTWGQVGLPSAEAATLPGPFRVEPLAGHVAHVATTTFATCASLDDGSLYCWGGNSEGALGQGTIDSDEHPTPVRVKL